MGTATEASATRRPVTFGRACEDYAITIATVGDRILVILDPVRLPGSP